jgi:thiamine-phosphate pyrophosphorylase
VLAEARLYAITPDSPPDDIENLVGAVLEGGAGCVQLRHKTLPRGELLDLARRLSKRVHDAGALFIVNDYLDIAMLAGADGVHLGADDLSIESARRLAGPGFLIGASASTPDTARAAVAAGADYIGAGPAFATPVKSEKAVIGPEGVAAVTQAVEVPVFAIGGIDADNIGRLVEVGVRRACVIRALAAAPDPAATARRLLEALSA